MNKTLVPLALSIVLLNAVAGDLPAVTGTVVAEMALEVQAMKAGGWKHLTRRFQLPDSCEYVSHDIGILSRAPAEGDEDALKRNDLIDHVRRDSTGRVTSLHVSIGAHRPLLMGDGPAAIAVRISLTARCTGDGMSQLRRRVQTT